MGAIEPKPATGADTPPAPPRVVLDTNVCLDLFVFADPRVAVLRAALQAGAVAAVSNAECRDEWLRVLDYPKLQLHAAQREAARRAFDACVQCLPAADVADPVPGAATEAAQATLAASVTRLPRCADPDDQKFLQLAQASGACWLLSRDDALLVLGRRTARDGLFAIMAPEAWSPPARGEQA